MSCVQAFMYLSILGPSSDGAGDQHYFLQVIKMPGNDILPETYRTREAKRGAYDIVVQYLEVSDAANNDKTWNVFALEDPTAIDLLAITGSDLGATDRIFTYSRADAEVPGCVGLTERKVLQSAVELTSSNAP
eukprot:1232039-Pyramimonas_sp.AAC.1